MDHEKVVVITGSTRGIGLGLAEEFVKHGCAVVVSGRQTEAVQMAAEKLGKQTAGARIAAIPCDVTMYAQVQALWDETMHLFGRVDIWVNNAGLGQRQESIWELDPQAIDALVRTNVLGVLYGMKTAAAGMQKQGFGAIYTMEGMGSDGRIIPGVSVYGTTKHAVKYLTDAVARELKHTGIIVGALRPGMVVTEMITGPYKDRPELWQQVRKIFSIISDRVETVTPWLVKKMLSNRRTGVRFSWFTAGRALFRFMSASFVKRDPFAGRL